MANLTTSFLIPFRDADGTRTTPMLWIVDRWRASFPDAEFILGVDDGMDPFNKSMAVNDAARRASGDVFLILDADSWVQPETAAEAIAAVRDGKHPWVIPCDTSLRLTKEASARVMALTPDQPIPRVMPGDVEQQSYVIGFLHIVPRDAFETVGGMDERFRGWGGEDGAFTRAMDVIHGRHAKYHGQVFSLWHDRPRDGNGHRIWLGQWERHTNNRTWRHYTRADSRDKMFAVLRADGGPLAPVSRTRQPQKQLSRGDTRGMATFRCSKYPALMVRFGGRKFKFIGGKLTVRDDVAPLVRSFAAMRPAYSITEDSPPPEVHSFDPDADLDAKPLVVKRVKRGKRAGKAKVAK